MLRPLCKAVTVTATTLFPNHTHLQQDATDVSQKFLDAFSLFAACHQLYDSSSLMSDVEITQLGDYDMFGLSVQYHQVH